MTAVLIGTAGWTVPAHHAAEFTGPGSHLERYAQRFNAVEINSSFHRGHRRETYARWAASVPDAFRFSVKLPKSVTHKARLEDCEAQVRAFANEVGGLGDKLGAVLVQLPPSLALDRAVAEPFFVLLRSAVEAPLACEPRHASWATEEAEQLMIEQRVSRVAADPVAIPDGGRPGGWQGLEYMRLHGSPTIYRSAYGEERLRQLASAVLAVKSNAKRWCMFDNTASMAATTDALLLQAMLRRSPRTSPAASERGDEQTV